jgi:cobalt-zinc-cadmium efflux system protein
MDRRESLRVLLIGLALISFFAMVEFVGGLITNSLALLSDAGHMITDATSLLIAVVAQVLVLKAKGKKSTYGFYRLEVFAALLNSLFLFGLIGYIAYEAVHRFLNPEPVKGFQMLLIAFIGLVINLIVGYMLYKSSEDNINVKAAFLHVVTDTLGSVAAILSGLAIVFMELYVADPILSVAICLLIIPSAYSVLKNSVRILLEIAPAHLDIEEITHDISSIRGVKDVHDLHVWAITHGNVVLTAHVVVEDLGFCNDILEEVNRIAQRHGISHTTVQLEREGSSCPATCPLMLKPGRTHYHGHEH